MTMMQRDYNTELEQLTFSVATAKRRPTKSWGENVVLVAKNIDKNFLKLRYTRH